MNEIDKHSISECEVCGFVAPPTRECLECGAWKCESCDMGGDVPCMACEDLEGEED